MDFTDFSMDTFIQGIQGVRPQAEHLAVSDRTAQGFDRLLDWITSRR
ncbi:MAG: hypothetical protein ACOC8N_03560 [Spirochaetota bacterium]